MHEALAPDETASPDEWASFTRNVVTPVDTREDRSAGNPPS